MSGIQIISVIICQLTQIRNAESELILIGLGLDGMGWDGLGWVGLGWVGLGWVGLG